MTSPLALRVAIVGAGPAGIYAGNILASAVADEGGRVDIDLFESLPAPYGLIRYGVAPDHPRIKGVVTSLHEMLDARADSDGGEGSAGAGSDIGDGSASADSAVTAAGRRRRIRLIGNVEVARDVTLRELHERYHAVILATGASRDAALSIPGIHLPGSHGAADFVAWYDGHPDVSRTWPLDASEVAVIGNGNVALDVARVLVKHGRDQRGTEVPDNVLAGLESSRVTDVHVFGRRGPESIKFTPIELRELGEVPDVDIVLADEDFAHLESFVAGNNQLKVMLRTLQQWRERPSGTASRRLHLHFYHQPVAVLGRERVEGVRFERTGPVPGEQGAVRGTGELREVPVQAVYRAVGYAGSPVVGAPFDAARGVIPNVEGRVTDAPFPGLYATGWIKRGPVGLIGHTKSDALETVGHLLADARAGLLSPPSVDDDVVELLAEREADHTTWEGWLALDGHERALGAAHRHARERVKLVPRDEQVALSRPATLARA